MKINTPNNMKNLVLLLLLFTGIVKAQIVNIPDANFKAKLLAADVTNQIASYQYGYNVPQLGFVKIDSNNDGEIQLSEAQMVSYLNINQSNIISLEGITFFSNLRHLQCASNQLAILDLSQNTNLIFLDCSQNQLSFLSFSQNINLVDVSCSSNQLTSLDFSQNINLVKVSCSSNQLTSLDFFQNVSLEFLSCASNQITNLDISNNILLKDLSCGFNQLTFIDVSNNINLNYFRCDYNLLSNLDVINNIELRILSCDSNQLSSLDVSNCLNLSLLICNLNQITSMDLSSNINLIWLRIDNNFLTELNINNNANLELLSFKNNQISELNLSNNIQLMLIEASNNLLTNLDINNNLLLKSVYCNNNQIYNLNTTNNVLLENIYCKNNQLTSLDLSNNIKLTYLVISNNLLTSLNVIKNINLIFLDCSSNQLTTIFAKNGSNEEIALNNNQNLAFICLDANQIVEIQTQLDSFNYINTVCNSYCSFTPEGNFNTISGNVKFDSNNNGCDANDLPQPNIRVNINDSINTGASFTNTTGNYSFFTQAGSFAITPAIENPTWFTFSPNTATIPFANNNNNIAIQDFCIAANGVHPDLEVVASPFGVARPGFDAQYYVTYKNKGNQTLSGVVNLVFDDAKTDFIAANPAVDNLAVNSLSWNYSNLLPFEVRKILVTLNLNSPVETPAVNIGDVLNFTPSITPFVGDELSFDNTFSYNQTVVGSIDPNTIECLEGTSVAPSEIGKYLHYAINFENTGNFPAENVVVKTIIDPAKFDINTLQLLNTSSPVDARITGNVVEFIFKNVQLAGPGGHGHVLLKVKSKNTLVAGDNVSKNANIYFDYNAPVDTGLVTTVFQSLSNSVFVKDDSVLVSPNPTSGKITINCNSVIKTIEVYDVQGRVLQTVLNTNNLDISDKTNGVYFIKITTEKGSKVEKIIKE